MNKTYLVQVKETEDCFIATFYKDYVSSNQGKVDAGKADSHWHLRKDAQKRCDYLNGVLNA